MYNGVPEIITHDSMSLRICVAVEFRMNFHELISKCLETLASVQLKSEPLVLAERLARRQSPANNCFRLELRIFRVP